MYLKELNRLQKELKELCEKKKDLNDSEVLKLSQEIDELINIYYQDFLNNRKSQ